MAPPNQNVEPSRHRLGRAVFHGKRGELRQRYREGQEDQLGALGLVLNVIVLWTTIYIEAALEQLRQDSQPVHEEDVARLSPLIHNHINLLGRYSFAILKPSSEASCARCIIRLRTTLNCLFCSVTPDSPKSKWKSLDHV